MNSTNLSSRTIVIIAVAGILLVAGGLLLSAVTPNLFPAQASAESTQIDGLFRILLIIGGAIFLLVQGLLAYSVWRFRAKPGDTSDGAHIHGNNTLELVWTAIPAVIVVILTILSWQVWSDLQTPKEGEMKVHVAGARFNWAYSYDVPLSILPESVDEESLPQTVKDDLADDGMISVTAPVLYTYAGQPVVLEMKPADVIHSFWVPAFRVKQDLIPGRVTTVRFTPTLPGTYKVKCAELCGANHGLMYGDVVVLDDEAGFNEAIIPLVAAKVFPPVDPVARGEALLSSNVYPCNTCHVLSSLSAFNWVGNVGPNLTGIADRAATSRSGATGLSPAEYLYQAVHQPTAYVVPGYGPLMPDLGIPECQVWDIVAYLSTQSETGTAPFEVEIPPQCVVSSQPGAESTAEATGEATAEATVEATVEVTAESTAAAAGTEATAEATAAPTSEATSEATAEATAGS